MYKKYKSDIKLIHYFLIKPRYHIQQCVLYWRMIHPSCGPECGWAATSISIQNQTTQDHSQITFVSFIITNIQIFHK
jgi:hypothetical protein